MICIFHEFREFLHSEASLMETCLRVRINNTSGSPSMFYMKLFCSSSLPTGPSPSIVCLRISREMMYILFCQSYTADVSIIRMQRGRQTSLQTVFEIEQEHQQEHDCKLRPVWLWQRLHHLQDTTIIHATNAACVPLCRACVCVCVSKSKSIHTLTLRRLVSLFGDRNYILIT